MNKEGVLNLLDEKHIFYEITAHPPVFTIEDMLAADIPHSETVAKNLFVRDDKKKNYYLISVREEKRVDLRRFAEKYGTRKLSFASEKDLHALLGVIPGSVTPFGLLNDGDARVIFYLDRDFADGLISIHPNENTATVRLKTADLIALLRDAGHETIFFDNPA